MTHERIHAILDVKDPYITVHEWMYGFCYEHGYDSRFAHLIAFAVAKWKNLSTRAALGKGEIGNVFKMNLTYDLIGSTMLLSNVSASDRTYRHIRKGVTDNQTFECTESRGEHTIHIDMSKLAEYIAESGVNARAVNAPDERDEKIKRLEAEIAELRSQLHKDEEPKTEEVKTIESMTPAESDLVFEMKFNIKEMLNKRDLDKSLRGVLEDSPIGRDEFLDSFAYWLVREWPGDKPFVLHPSGKGLEKLFATHAKFLSEKGTTSKQHQESEAQDIANKFVEFMRNDDVGSKMSIRWGDYVYANVKSKIPRPEEWYKNEASAIADALTRGLVQKDQLRQVMINTIGWGAWRTMKHSGHPIKSSFQEYDFGKPQDRQLFNLWLMEILDHMPAITAKRGGHKK